MEGLHDEVTNLQLTQKAHGSRPSTELSEEFLKNFARARKASEPTP
jgi:hypothetical protein